MIFIFNSMCIVLLSVLNRRTKILAFVLFFLLLMIVGLIYIPKELKEDWVIEMAAFLVLLAIYTIILISITCGRGVILFFNPKGFKNENIIRNIYVYIFAIFIVFVSYFFFIKGIIYD